MRSARSFIHRRLTGLEDSGLPSSRSMSIVNILVRSPLQTRFPCTDKLTLGSVLMLSTEVVIQATAGNRIVARETIKPFRKDVLAKLHAADVSRRRKLLEKQKEGRKRLRAVGNVIIDQSAFQSFMSR